MRRWYRADQQNANETDLTREARARCVGDYTAGEPDDDRFEVLRVMENDAVLILRKGPPGAKADVWFHLVPLGDHRFRVGRYQDGRLVAIDDGYTVRFELVDGVATELKLIRGDGVLISAKRAQ